MLALSGLGLLALAGSWAARTLGHSGIPETRQLLTAAVLAWIGLFCGRTSYRLILRRARTDGGLFSPTFLRLSGVVLGVGPLVGLLFLPWSWLNVVPLVGITGACFALARHREQHLRNLESLDPAA